MSTKKAETGQLIRADKKKLGWTSRLHSLFTQNQKGYEDIPQTNSSEKKSSEPVPKSTSYGSYSS
jgi:hypothetical protein